MLIEEVAKTPGMRLRIQHVPGHGTCTGNIGADALGSKWLLKIYVEKKNRERWMKGYRGKPLVYVRSTLGWSRRTKNLKVDKRQLSKKAWKE